MSRRPFSFHNNSSDFNSYYSNINTLSLLKFARSHHSSHNNSFNPLFSLNQCDINPSLKNIVYYKSYDTLINLSKISSLLNPSSSSCADVPLNLINGLQSEVCYNELYETDCTKLNPENKFCGCARCLKIPIINNCHEKTGKMYPYGRFNNSIKNPAIKINSLKCINSECEEKLKCPTYIMCKCSTYNKNCDCCKFTTTTPFDEESNIKYTDNSDISCHDYIDHHLRHLPPEQLIKLQEMKDKKLQEDKILSKKAINIYSKFGAPNVNHIKH